MGVAKRGSVSTEKAAAVWGSRAGQAACNGVGPARAAWPRAAPAGFKQWPVPRVPLQADRVQASRRCRGLTCHTLCGTRRPAGCSRTGAGSCKRLCSNSSNVLVGSFTALTARGVEVAHEQAGSVCLPHRSRMQQRAAGHAHIGIVGRRTAANRELANNVVVVQRATILDNVNHYLRTEKQWANGRRRK